MYTYQVNYCKTIYIFLLFCSYLLNLNKIVKWVKCSIYSVGSWKVKETINFKNWYTLKSFYNSHILSCIYFWIIINIQYYISVRYTTSLHLLNLFVSITIQLKFLVFKLSCASIEIQSRWLLLTSAACVAMHQTDSHILFFQEDGAEMVGKLALFTPG